MRLSPGAFNRFMTHIGQQFSWRKAYDCPCVNPHSGAALPTCKNCNGTGRTWVAAVSAVAGAAGAKIQREWAQFGQWESGDIVLTIPESSPMYDMGEFDRVTMLNGDTQFSMNLVRGQDDKIGFPVVSVSRVFWYDENEDSVEAGIPSISGDGSLSWTPVDMIVNELAMPIGGEIEPSGEPPAGKTYSISGNKRPEYYCFGPFPSNRMMHQGARLPRLVVLRRFDLLGRR